MVDFLYLKTENFELLHYNKILSDYYIYNGEKMYGITAKFFNYDS
jgi:hypothetical protein